MRNRFIIFLLLLIPLSVSAQQQSEGEPFIRGTVTDEKRQPIEGVVVSVFSTDSTFLANTLSDSTGFFRMEIVPQDVRITTRMMGYENRYLSVKKENRTPITIALKPAINLIDEVVVKGRNIVRKDDKLMIFLPERTKRNAYDGYSALSSLNIPGLRVDMFSQSVTTHGSATLLCINGREVNTDEVSTLNPADIKRIDYYQMQDPSHPGAEAVIDFILVNRDNGGQVFAKANHHLNIGKGGTTVDVKQYRKRTEFNAQLSGSYTRYTPDKGELSTTAMPFADETIQKQVTTEASPQRHNSATARFSLLHQWKGEQTNNMFNAAAYLKRGHTINNTRMTESYNEEKTASGNRKHSDNSSPMLQLYYEGKSPKSLLRAKLYGSYSNSRQDRDYNSLIAYSSTTDQDFYYVAPSFTYAHSIGKRHLSAIQLQYEYNNIKTQYADNAQDAGLRQQYGYGYMWLIDNFKVVPNKFHLTFQLGGRMETIDNGNSTDTKLFFTPSLFYKVFLPHNHNINGNFAIGTVQPTESQYNETEQTVDPYQRLRGNANLITPKVWGGVVRYSHDGKWGGYELETEYEQQTNPIFKEITPDNTRGVYVQQYRNGNKWQSLRSSAAVTINMFEGKLSWMNGLEYLYLKDDMTQVASCGKIAYGTSLSCNLRSFMARLDFTTATRSLYAGTMYKGPVNLSLSMAYTYRKWHFTLDVKNPFYRVWNEREYRYGGYASTSRQYNPYTGYNVFSFGVNYRINYGKKHKFQEVQMYDSVKSAILEE